MKLEKLASDLVRALCGDTRVLLVNDQASQAWQALRDHYYAKLGAWQDIATAPKKGSFLGYANVAGFNNYFICRWWKGDDLNEPRWEGGYGPPTHWMPLPPAPASPGDATP